MSATLSSRPTTLTRLMAAMVILLMAASTVELETAAGAATGVPSAPRLVHIVGGDTLVTVTWAPPSANKTSVAKYVVTANPSGKTCELTSYFPQLRCVLTGLKNGTSYTFTVAALNKKGIGTASRPSSKVKVMGLPMSSLKLMTRPSINPVRLSQTTLTFGSRTTRAAPTAMVRSL